MKNTEEQINMDMIKDIEVLMVNTKEELQHIYDESMSTITGAGGNILEWISGLNNWLKENNFGKATKFYVFKGKDVNEAYSIKGDNRYQPDVTFLSWENEGLDNLKKYFLKRFDLGIRWFDDIIDNACPEIVEEQHREAKALTGLIRFRDKEITAKEYVKLYNKLSSESKSDVVEFGKMVGFRFTFSGDGQETMTDIEYIGD